MHKKRLAPAVLLLMLLVSCGNQVNTTWQEIDPSELYPDFTYNGLSPSCSACPAYTDLSGNAHPAGDPAFKFFYREGASNNLVIYFQGGGACWATENCLYEHTYTGQLEAFENAGFLQKLSRGSYELFGYGGIFQFLNPGNPLRDWDFVYIPYCTGDLHAGANDATYPSDPEVPTEALHNQYDGAAQTIRHRGAVNVQAVLKWIAENRKPAADDTVLVTGISGGSYGAMFNFSSVCEKFPGANVYLLGDAGNGVIAPDFMKTAAPVWKLELPDIPELAGRDITEISIAELYSKLAGHYANSRIAQYTTRYDNTQSWFYNMQLEDTINYPDTWSDGENMKPSTVHTGGTWQELVEKWSANMMTLRDQTVAAVPGGADNYRYYIASGRDHTILMAGKFYTEKSGGSSFAKWVDDFIAGDTMPASTECSSCGSPVQAAGAKLYPHRSKNNNSR